MIRFHHFVRFWVCLFLLCMMLPSGMAEKIAEEPTVPEPAVWPPEGKEFSNRSPDAWTEITVIAGKDLAMELTIDSDVEDGSDMRWDYAKYGTLEFVSGDPELEDCIHLFVNQYCVGIATDTTKITKYSSAVFLLRLEGGRYFYTEFEFPFTVVPENQLSIRLFSDTFTVPLNSMVNIYDLMTPDVFEFEPQIRYSLNLDTEDGEVETDNEQMYLSYGDFIAKAEQDYHLVLRVYYSDTGEIKLFPITLHAENQPVSSVPESEVRPPEGKTR